MLCAREGRRSTWECSTVTPMRPHSSMRNVPSGVNGSPSNFGQDTVIERLMNAHPYRCGCRCVALSDASTSATERATGSFASSALVPSMRTCSKAAGFAAARMVSSALAVSYAACALPRASVVAVSLAAALARR
jgi:hypothetical protein